MKLKVAMFAAARQIAGAIVELEFEHSPTVADVQSKLVKLHPKLETLVARSILAVDQEYATPEQVLSDGCEVALIPPVSGG